MQKLAPGYRKVQILDIGGDPMTKTQAEIVTSVRQRRRWSRAEKERVVAAAMEPGAVASAVAREAGIQASQLFRWRRQLHGAARFASLTLEVPTDAAAITALPMSSGVIEVEFTTGARLRICGPVDAVIVAAVLQALTRCGEGSRSRISGVLSMRIAMIGTGYVGLVSGACIADFGHEVTCVDKDGTKISALESGEIPIYEPGLKDIVQSNVRQGRLQFTTALSDALKGAHAAFIAVGTPSRRGDGHADLSYVYEAAREIASALTDFIVIITKSTVPVGTGDEVERIIRELRPDIDVAVVSNPEFLREGAAIRDFKHPDRIVIGTDDERAKRVLAEIYRPLYLNQAPILYTGRRTAELIKYAANAFLATKITFINEIADLCEKLGSDVQEVARGIGLDKRIGSKFLHAGPG